LKEAIKCHFKKSVKEGNHCPRTSQQSDPGLLTRVVIDYYPLHPKYRPFLLSEWISAALSLKKAQRRRGDRDDDERRRGTKQRTTPRTWDRGEPEHEAVPQLDPRACR
jgi:hypothetical protein